MAQCVTCGAGIKPGVTRCLKCGTLTAVVGGPPPLPPQSPQYAPPYQYPAPPAYGQQPQIVYVQQVQPLRCTKNRTAAGLLAIFLGAFGVHKFYLGKVLQGIFCVLFFWTYIPAIIGFVEGIWYLTMSEETFCQKFGQR